MVRNLQDTDWHEVRMRWERRVANVWGNVRGTEAGREIEGRFRENVVGEGRGDGLKGGVEEVGGGGKRLLEIK